MGDCQQCGPDQFGNCTAVSTGITTSDLAARTGFCDANSKCVAVFTSPEKYALLGGVRPGMIENGFCEPACYTSSCMMDAGDCNSCVGGDNAMAQVAAAGLSFNDYCSVGCRRSMLLNGCCDPACNNECCGFDNQKCNSVVRLLLNVLTFGYCLYGSRFHMALGTNALKNS